jgi:hypothetical protein
VEYVEVDGSIEIGRKIAEQMAVEIDVGFAGPSDVEGGVSGNGCEAKVHAEIVRGCAELGTVPWKFGVVWTESCDVVGGPDVLLGEGLVGQRRGRLEITGGIEWRGSILRCGNSGDGEGGAE